jgi:hypothetical protein
VERVGLAARAAELGLGFDEFESLEPRLTSGVAAAVLAALIRYEDALMELAAESDAAVQEQPR